MAKKSKPQFPPLAPGSEINLSSLEQAMGIDTDLAKMHLRYGCALAAAEWEDVADNPDNHNKATGVVLNASRQAKIWHAFRREHTKGGGR